MAYGNFIQLTGANQQLPTATGNGFMQNLATVEAACFLLHNAGSTTENICIYIGGTAVSNRLFNVTLAGGEDYEWSPKIPIPLSNANTIYGSTTTISTVNVKIIGRQNI